MPEKAEHRSTGRVLDVLELIAASKEGYSLTEICTEINAPKSSMFPILHTLQEREYLIFNSFTSKYTIGPMSFQVGSAFPDHFEIMEQIQTEMHNIVNICAETCHFAVLVGGDVLYLKKIDSPESIRMISMVGKRLPAYGTGLGKALLMDYDSTALKKLYPDGLRPLTENTITDIETLCKQLERARNEGFAYEIEESNRYIRCIAVPVRKDHRIVAALSVAIPTFRYSEEKDSLIRQLLNNAKTRIECWLRIVPAEFSGHSCP